MEILKLLYRKPLSVEEIAGMLKLQTITIRHHLQALIEADLVACHEERSGGAGRPRAYYSIVKNPPSASFPRRQYQLLSETLLTALIDELGISKTKAFLKKIGLGMGEEAIKQLESIHKVKSWTPVEYQKYLIEGYFEEEGAEPEVLEATKRKIAYRLHNCLFRELSTKMPDVMCDVLHESFNQGVSKAIGKDLQITRLKCMGHNDSYCEHVCVWSVKSK